MKDINLSLNDTSRDTALVQILIKTRVNQFLLARIYAKLYGSSDKEIDRIVKGIEKQELDAVFRFLSQEAGRGQLYSLLNPDPPEDPLK